MDCWKKQYNSKQKAENVLKEIKKNGRILAPNTYTYQCPNCGWWHIGHDKFYKEKKGQLEMEMWKNKS